MAEGSNSEDSWWNWIQNTKEKVVAQSSEVLEFVKNDIDEFTKVVSDETSAVVSSTASALKNKLKLEDEESTANHMKKSMSGFLSHVADVFTPPPDDADEEAFVINNQQPVMLSRLEASVYAKVQDSNTFLQEPEDEDDYNKWLDTFEMDSKQIEMADLLVSCKPLHKQFSSMVPTQVSHTAFWHRYYYCVHRLQKQEDKRKQISSRVTDIEQPAEILWEDDEALGGDVDIPEEVQTQLLQQYEQELADEEETNDEQTESALDENTVEASPKKSEQLNTNKSSKSPNTKQPQSILNKKQSESKNSKQKPSNKQTAIQNARTSAQKKANNKNDNKSKTTKSSIISSARSSPGKDLSSDSNDESWEKIEAATEEEPTAATTEASETAETPATESSDNAANTETTVEKPIDNEEKSKGGDWETWD